MPSSIETLLAPGALGVAFQPIYDFIGGRRRVHAVEGLVRGPAGSHFERPTVLFEYMRLKHAETRADLASARAVLTAAAALPDRLHFSLNAHAATLSREPEFLVSLSDLLSMHAIDPERVTVEIVEHAPEWAMEGLGEALAALRTIGMRIAIDHLGRGQSNFKALLDIRPDYLKIDHYFVTGVHADTYRMAVVEAAVMLAQRFGARVIAVGVDDTRDLEALGRLGVDLVQGHLLSAAVPAADLGEVLAREAALSEE